jgi:hypothetical protein
MKFVTPALRRKVKYNPIARKITFTIENLWVKYTRAPIQDPSVGSSNKQYFVSAFTRSYNEGPFLIEWIAHHILSGIEHFYIYDNGSTDDTAAILEPLVHQGLVTYVYMPSKPISPHAERHFLRNYAADTEWIAYFDLDEFLDVRGNRSLSEILSDTISPAIAIHWRYFGSSWRTNLLQGSMLDDLTRSARHPNQHVKVIARTRDIRDIRNSHSFYYMNGRLARTVDGVAVFGSVELPKEDESELELRHYLFRGAADVIRKSESRYSVDSKYSARIESDLLDQYNMNNDIERPLATNYLRRKDRLSVYLKNGQFVSWNNQLQITKAGGDE